MSAGRTVTGRNPGPEARKLATQCVLMARFIADQRATLETKVRELAGATGWDAEEARKWVEWKAKR
ncbi:MAG: hypothetical protein OXU64_09010 [Gemmatimonadota bacterium]|nr:hypothetical protein [Gemmatimonadota bacterium]